MKTAGVVFDFYDDPTGSFVKQAFPTPQDLPDAIKKAHILNSEERDVLRNEAFALVMHNEGKILRKFACVDEGNLLLSLTYFEKTASRLPDEARQVAAQNLAGFCERFGYAIPDFLKTAASGMSRTRDTMRQPMVGDEADWSQRTNLVSVRGGADSGRVIPTANQMKTAGIVDVTDKQAPLHIEKKAHQTLALGRYPLDSYADVKKAVDYFEQNWTEMHPEDRHAFAVKTAARAGELGIGTPELLERYGATTYAPDLEAHLATRKAVAQDEFKGLFDELKEKKASVEPEAFADMLRQVDEAAGLNWYWGGHVSDPYYATFGKVASCWSWKSPTGEYLSEENIRKLARNGRPLIKKHFSSEITNAFIKDPITIFESLPTDSKTIFCRLANDLTDGLPTN